MKLSDKQKEIINLMRDGYEGGHSRGFWSNTWLQQGGAGNGGKSASVSIATLDALEKKQLVYSKTRDWRTIVYNLTELGKTIEI